MIDLQYDEIAISNLYAVETAWAGGRGRNRRSVHVPQPLFASRIGMKACNRNFNITGLVTLRPV